MRVFSFTLFIIVTALLFSCEDSNIGQIECSKEILTVGDTSVTDLVLVRLDTLIKSMNRCDTAFYYINIGSSGLNEIKFSSWLCYGLTFYEGDFYIETIGKNSKILLSDSLDSPKILDLHDTISINQNFHPGRYNLVYCWGFLNPSTGEQSHNCKGLWQKVDQKYIGFNYQDGEFMYLGWIKVDIVYAPEPRGAMAIYLHEYAYLKCRL